MLIRGDFLPSSPSLVLYFSSGVRPREQMSQLQRGVEEEEKREKDCLSSSMESSGVLYSYAIKEERGRSASTTRLRFTQDSPRAHWQATVHFIYCKHWESGFHTTPLGINHNKPLKPMFKPLNPQCMGKRTENKWWSLFLIVIVISWCWCDLCCRNLWPIERTDQ